MTKRLQARAISTHLLSLQSPCSVNRMPRERWAFISTESSEQVLSFLSSAWGIKKGPVERPPGIRRRIGLVWSRIFNGKPKHFTQLDLGANPEAGGMMLPLALGKQAHHPVHLLYRQGLYCWCLASARNTKPQHPRVASSDCGKCYSRPAERTLGAGGVWGRQEEGGSGWWEERSGPRR